MHAVPGMVEGVSTRPTVDFTGLHVTIPAQPVTVAYGVITSYIVSVERYSSGDHQSRIVSATQNSSSETVTFNGLSKLVCDRKFLSCSDTHSTGLFYEAIIMCYSHSLYTAQLIPYNISVSAANMVGVGERAVYINFTKEGSK